MSPRLTGYTEFLTLRNTRRPPSHHNVEAVQWFKGRVRQMVGFPPYGHSKDRKYFLGPEKRQLLYVESVPMFYAFCKLLTKLIILINVKNSSIFRGVFE